jgi:hypothetical protein
MRLRLALCALLLVAAFPIVAQSQVPSIVLDWTAPGDDGTVGTATSYDMRWNTTRPDTTTAATFTAWWNTANPVAGMPVPAIAGTAQSATVAPVGGFGSGLTFYFVLRATDDAGNVSAFSNVAWKAILDTVAPARIADLRVRP